MPNDSRLMRVRKALQSISDPQSNRNIIAAGYVAGLAVTEDGVARFTLESSAMDEKTALSLLEDAKKAALMIDGITKVSAVATRHSEPSTAPTAGHDNPMGLRGKKKKNPQGPILPGVKNVIAVASGKGGVGKSTLAANLAVAFAKAELRTGIMDADIYGPSLPTLFGLSDKPAMRDGQILPMEAFGVKAMSIGLLVNTDQALAWRGPMVMGAVRQLMNDVAWGDLDVLLIDTPPGTGDVHLSLAQTKRLTGAVIVSTPQEMALADVRRGIQLFRKVEVPVFGIIENMAWFETPTGERLHLFGEGGAKKVADDLNVPFLGELPILQTLRETSDNGVPATATPTNEAGKAIEKLAQQLSKNFDGVSVKN